MKSKHFLTEKGYGGKCVPSLSPVISEDQLVPEGDTVLVGANGVIKVVKQGIKVEGYSDVESPDFAFGRKPDGKGGWMLPAAPDATSVRDWTLKAALAAKGVSFIPSDATIAARWQFEPSFAIDGVVATALKASLGYDASQLQALFNDAAALK